MRIINILTGFQNAYNEPGWQLWDGSDLVGVYHTRKAARAAITDFIDSRTDYDSSSIKFHRDGTISAVKDADKTFAGHEPCLVLVAFEEGR